MRPGSEQTVSHRGAIQECLAEPRKPVPAVNGNERRVLVVDDSGPYRSALRSVLESIDGVEVAEAESAEAAIDLLPEVRPQLVLMDINLPGMNGIDATAMVIAREPGTVVVGISVNTDEQTRQAICEAGAVMLVNKGSGIGTVLAVVERYL